MIDDMASGAVARHREATLCGNLRSQELLRALLKKKLLAQSARGLALN
jgi:hypothetical protein